MLGRKLPAGSFKTINLCDTPYKLFLIFLKDQSINWVVAVDDDNKPAGVIYRDDISTNHSEQKKNISDYCNRKMITFDSKKSADNVDPIMFSNIKNNINVFPILDEKGCLCGLWERIIQSDRDNEFLRKFLMIKQAGYSLADWFIYHGYRKIGIHSFVDATALLASELERSDIEIVFVADNIGRHGINGKIPEKPFNLITKEEISECDVIVNAFYSLNNQVSYLYKTYKGCSNVVSIYDIVDELWSYEFMAGYMLRVANMIAASGRKVYIFDYPRLVNVKNKSEREKLLLEKNFNWINLQRMIIEKEASEYKLSKSLAEDVLNSGRKRHLDKIITFEDYAEIYPNCTKIVPRVTYEGDYARLMDMNSEFCNIIDGKRVTASAKKEMTIDFRVHFFGKSWVFGHQCADEYTIPSHFQRICNELNMNCEAINYGIGGLKEDVIVNNMKFYNDILPKKDIFVLVHMFEDYGNKYNSCTANEMDYIHKLSADRPHNYGEVWFDTGHLGESGTEMIAEQIYHKIFEENCKPVPGKFVNKYNHNAGRTIYKYENAADEASQWAEIPEFHSYSDYLSENKCSIGSIVMNCNPFTLGHRYLIEKRLSSAGIFIFLWSERTKVYSALKTVWSL